MPEATQTQETKREFSSLKKQLAYGPGGFSENLATNSIAHLVIPVFSIAFGVNPALVGVVMSIPRLVDAFTDPLMGSISDNWKGRWGRRRPFIFLGSILSGLVVALFWWTPVDASDEFHLVWLLFFLLLSTVGTTMFGVPYIALGMETPEDETEVTAWMAWRSAFHKSSGVVVQWLFFFVQLGIFSSVVVGARVIGVVLGLIIMGLGSLPAFLIQERTEVHRMKERVSMWRSWGLTLRNRNFLILSGVAMMVIMSVVLVNALGFYLQIYYVFEGDLTVSSFFKGIGGSIFHILGIVSIPFIVKLAAKFGKLRAFYFCIFSIVLGGILRWFCFFPGAGWISLIPNVFLAPGIVSVWVLVPSMLADIAAEDERRTGNSRQGMFAATMNWVKKLSNSGVSFLSGMILIACGWVNELGVDQAATTYASMRWTFALGTIAMAVSAMLLLGLYRLNASDDVG